MYTTHIHAHKTQTSHVAGSRGGSRGRKCEVASWQDSVECGNARAHRFPARRATLARGEPIAHAVVPWFHATPRRDACEQRTERLLCGTATPVPRADTAPLRPTCDGPPINMPHLARSRSLAKNTVQRLPPPAAGRPATFGTAELMRWPQSSL